MHKIDTKFVEFIPEELEEAILYVSMEYATAAHKCACGCGNKVVTPFSPRDWQLYFDGKTISLHPSVGNPNSVCLSHYWIRKSRIIWASPMFSKEKTRFSMPKPQGIIARFKSFWRRKR